MSENQYSIETLKKEHPKFLGNWEDLKQFLLLTHSPIRTVQREQALEAWRIYKKHRQIHALQSQNSKERVLTKGGYIKSLTMQVIDLRGASLDGIILGYADMRGVKLDYASMQGAWMKGSAFQDASLREINGQNMRMMEANFDYCDLSGSNLQDADFSEASFKKAKLPGANLRGSDISRAIFIGTNLEDAALSNCHVYGISAWDIKINDKTQQDNLLITTQGEAHITVDDIEVAQFIYLLLRRQKLRNVIDSITSKAVLILGRFTPERKQILDALAEQVRAHQLLPIIYDFEGSASRDFTETIKILAGMSLFVIADVSNPKSSPLELQATIPDYQIPFVTIIQQDEQPFSMLTSLKKYPWVLQPVLSYCSAEDLRKAFKKAILDRAWGKRNELLAHKSQSLQVQSIGDFLDSP